MGKTRMIPGRLQYTLILPRKQLHYCHLCSDAGSEGRSAQHIMGPTTALGIQRRVANLVDDVCEGPLGGIYGVMRLAFCMVKPEAHGLLSEC